jgi:hypothetical protein
MGSFWDSSKNELTGSGYFTVDAVTKRVAEEIQAPSFIA